MNFRNPIYNALGTIDCEIEHPVYGWIPFTASPDDPEQHGKDIYAAIIAAGNIAPYVPPEPVVVVPDSVSSRQFMMQLSISGLTAQVGAWVAAQDELVQIAFAKSGSFLRSEPMMQTGFTALGFTPEQIDAFFTAAALL